MIKLAEDLGKRDIGHPLYEANPHLPDRPSMEEYLKSPKKIIDFAGSGMSVLLPSWGINIGLASSLAALNNYRLAKRLEEMLL